MNQKARCKGCNHNLLYHEIKSLDKDGVGACKIEDCPCEKYELGD